MLKSLITFILISIVICESLSQVQLGNTTLDTSEIFSSLNEPWEIQVDSNSNLWLTERDGLVSIINPLTKTKTNLLDIRNLVWQNGESGLLGMTFSPDFQQDSLVFFAYTHLTNGNRYLKVVNYIYDSSLDTLLNESVIIDSIPANTFHDGCRLQFLPDQTLLISTGDAGNINLPQDKNNLAGKILRVNKDGSIPTNNPNSNSPIFSSGHRNPQGLFIYNNIIYSSEHGASTDDEINIIEMNRNFGWPNVEGFCNTAQEVQFCSDSMVQEPIFIWTPTVATSDIAIYDHPAIPEWRNNILLTTLKNRSLISLQLNINSDSVISTQTHFTNQWGRLRDICIGNRGELYMISNGFSRNGNQGQHKIIKIENINYVSIPEHQVSSSYYEVVPNPIEGQFYLKNFPNGNFIAQLRTTDGKQIQELSISNGKGEISNVSRGVYFLVIPSTKSLFKIVKL